MNGLLFIEGDIPFEGRIALGAETDISIASFLIKKFPRNPHRLILVFATFMISSMVQHALPEHQLGVGVEA